MRGQIARESVLKFRPNAKIVAHHGNVKEERFGVDFIRRFDVVLNGLDNLEVRALAVYTTRGDASRTPEMHVPLIGFWYDSLRTTSVHALRSFPSVLRAPRLANTSTVFASRPRSRWWSPERPGTSGR